ncbi:MAG: GNAT family N-acetyltransferase [Rhodobacterales bacterium]|nr:GNAT family N-acetyltransferase [Rhodobacterales bacterium]
MEIPSLPLQTTFGQVREAHASDADAAVAMALKLAVHHGDTASLSRLDLLREAFSDPPGIYLIIAEADGFPVGYALCGLLQPHFGARSFDMHHLFAETAFRCRGVGTSLVEACKLKAKQLSCTYLTVSTHPDNLAAQKFYETKGFLRRNDDGNGPRFGMRIGE